jgi:hypothetical protein
MNQTTKPYRITWSVVGGAEDFSDVILLTPEQAAEVEKRLADAVAKGVLYGSANDDCGIFGAEIYELEDGLGTWDDLLPCLDELIELAERKG